MHTRIGSLAFAVLLVTAQVALADGMFMAPEEAYGRLYGDLGATSTEQKGIIIEPAEGREVLLLQTTYHGPAAGFAWVIPVPGEPLDDDVFMASTEFIERVLDTTEPLVKTEIETPSADGIEDPGMMAPATEGVAGAEAEQVTLHRRMEVGDYDVSVLSATGPNVLVDWLNQHGYATPEEHASVFGHYVGKGWFFVALRVLPEVAEEKPVLNDVKPIGIEFPTERPIFPLYISRGSSREKTALTLVTLTREPVECEQLVRARLPLGDHGTGTSYARIRRDTIEAQARPSAIVEFAGYGGMTGERLHWREDGWPGENDADPRLLWATRLWTVVDLDAMEDLSFAPAEVRAERLAITRTGKLPEPPRQGGMLLPALVLTGIFLMLLAAYRLGVYTARPATLCIALTLLLGAGATLDRATLTSAHAGTVGGRDSGLSELDMALVRLDDAILSFLEEAGCYPAALEDLTVTVPPEVGLDSSGNAVPVGRDWLGSRIKELPIDPLTGRNDTWVYEVTGSPMIDSGGLDIAMACEPTVDRDRAAELAAEATVSYPFDEAHVGAAGFGDIVPLARMDIETSPGGVTIADATEGNAATLTLRRKGDAGVVTACLSPDNRRVAFARHYGSGFTIAACDLLYDGLGADTPPLIGNNHRRLLARPWYDVGYIQRMAWDPTGEHLAIAGSRDQPDGYVAVLFLLEPGAMPREIAAEEGDEWIDELHWAPDGRSIYMIERLERLPDRSGYAKKRLPVMASQYSLDGELMERQQTFRSCLAASEHGVAFAAPDAQTIIYRPREGEERRLAPPADAGGLLDLLPTERGVLAVYDHEAEPRGAVIFLHGTSGGPAEMIAQAPLPRDDDWSRPRLLGWQDGAVVFSVGMTPSGPLQVGEDPGVYIARRGQSAPQHIRLDLPGRGSRHYDEFPVAVTWE